MECSINVSLVSSVQSVHYISHILLDFLSTFSFNFSDTTVEDPAIFIVFSVSPSVPLAVQLHVF